MAFFKGLVKVVETAGHAVATGATAVADEVTGGNIQEMRQARRDQERRMHAAAREVERNAVVVGRDVGRVAQDVGRGTEDVGRGIGRVAQDVGRVVEDVAVKIGVPIAVLAKIITNPDQLSRLVELIDKHDFPKLLEALTSGGNFPDDFFPTWMRRAGGYFPKFAQVLSVRADLIHNPRVLEQFARCLEDMPADSTNAVRQHLRNEGWDSASCEGVGRSLNAGSVAQVNEFAMPDGSEAVVKVSWPRTKAQMTADFDLFSHAHSILRALRLDDADARTVSAIFSAVGKSRNSVLREFDLRCEADALRTAANLAIEWPCAHSDWLDAAGSSLPGLPQDMAMIQTLSVAYLRSAGWTLRVPEPFDQYSSEMAFAMTRAGGESMHRLITGDFGEVAQMEAAAVLLANAVPFIGWLLCCKSSSDLAHVDPHPGNFRWDSRTKELWVLDWGSHVRLPNTQRRALCKLITLVASGGADHDIAESARTFGVQCDDDYTLAELIRRMLNASTQRAAQDELNTAAMDGTLENVDDQIVPVVRCLATLGGMLKEVQRQVRDRHNHNVPLSLAELWSPFAVEGAL